MKTKHIAILVLIIASIMYLLTNIGNLSSYETIQSAKEKKGEFVHIIARLDTTEPYIYNANKDANLFTFSIKDSLGGKIKVMYNNPKPTDIEKAERIVLTGTVKNDYFECKEILIKCPSKYKDNTNKTYNPQL